MIDCVQGLWIGNKLSLMEQLSIKSFLAHGHRYHLYTYERIKNIPKGVIVKDANEIIPKKNIFTYSNKSYAGFSNNFRFKLLLEKGGWWADLDVICTNTFASGNDYVFSTERTKEGGIKGCLGILKAPKNSQFIKACFEKAQQVRQSNKLQFGSTGYDTVIPLISEFNLESYYASDPETYNPINWWEYKNIVNPNFRFRIRQVTRSIHLWNEMWRRESVGINLIDKIIRRDAFDKNTYYGPNTLYGHLQKMFL